MADSAQLDQRIGEEDAPASIANALEAAEDIYFRSGAPLSIAQLARIIDRHELAAEDAALLRVQARERGLLTDDSEEDSADPIAVVSDVGTGALSADFASLAPFWAAARRYPLLDAAGERSLAMRIEQGAAAAQLLAGDTMLAPATRAELIAQVQEAKQAKDTFICCNLRLVGSVTRPLRFQGLELPDLLQEGILGLIRAVEKFDYTLGYKFSTYATWWIRQAAQRGIADKGRTIRLPVHVHELLRKIIATERKLCWQLEREPTVHDVANELGIDAGHVAFVREAGAGLVSLDAAVRGDEADSTALVDFIAGTEPSVEQQVFEHQRSEQLDAALELLDRREAQLLRSRHGLGGRAPQTLDEVGHTLGVTRERVRQLESQALKKLRGLLDEDVFVDASDQAPVSTTPSEQSDDEETSASSTQEPGRREPARRRAEVARARSARRSAYVANQAKDAYLLGRMACLTEEEREVMMRRFGVECHSMSEGAVAIELERPTAWVFAQQSSAMQKLRASRPAA